MRTKILLAVFGMLLVPMATWATTTCTSDTAGNISDVTFDVCYTLEGSSLTINNVTGSVAGGGSIAGVKLLDISVYAGYTGISTSMTNWQTNTSANCNDGFSSSFAACLTQSPASDAVFANGPVGPFTLAGSNGSVLLHVGFGTCSGFVNFVPTGSTGTLLSPPNGLTASEAGCTIVPEPGSLALLGSGLVGAAAFLRRRFVKR